MKNIYDTLAIVIPSLDPTQGMVDYVKELIAQGFIHIYVVNDGSTSKYDHIFHQIAAVEGCTLLIHSYNRGKGAALKTAFHYITQQFSDCRGIITADSDGQHAVKDVCQLADSLLEERGGLLLGSRNFSQKGIPMKSWVGNRCSSVMFFLLNGAWVRDTQTGLRGFDTSLLPEMLSIEGDRFEYEMAVLATCASEKIPIHAVPIDTIYIHGNESSHFRPVADSMRIGGVLLGRFCQFMLSSGISCGVDLGVYWVLLAALSSVIPSTLLCIGVSVVVARLLSMVVNYTLNRGFVFEDATHHSEHSLERYLLLAIANMGAAIIFIYLLHQCIHMDEKLAKILVDTVLFMINFQVQRVWVFPQKYIGGTT